jgi:molecular chaperone Hsp33
LLSSSRRSEILDPDLAANDLLYRLFHEDGVRAFQPAALSTGCRCNRTRVVNILRSFPKPEIADMAAEGDGQVVMTCQFCNSEYRVTLDELEPLEDKE